VATGVAVLHGPPANAADTLVEKLARRDSKVLTKSLFSARPDEMVYPSWFEGEWDTTVKFNGFEFPTIEKFPKEALVADVAVAGFQKLSIAQLVDVGKPSTTYRTRWLSRPQGGAGGGASSVCVEDRAFNLKNAIDATLGFERVAPVERVDYDAKANPNRCSISFRGTTRNAERIELFTNARASETPPRGTSSTFASPTGSPTGSPANGAAAGGGAPPPPTSTPGSEQPTLRAFVCSELMRQVTYSLSTTAGVAREAITEYQYFWTYRASPSGTQLRANLLTCAYLEPQDPNFFKAPSQPVAVYSHTVDYRRVEEPQAPPSR